MDEKELLRVRAHYPKPSGWASARMWLFSPKNESQPTMGVNTVKDEGLFEKFVDEAGRNAAESEFSWESYKETCQRLSQQVDELLLVDFLWTLYGWAKQNGRHRPTHYHLTYTLDASKLVKLLWRCRYLPYLLSDFIDNDQPRKSLSDLKDAFDNVVFDPQATANLVSSFLQALRDISHEKRVLAAFFEGLTLTPAAGIKWTAGPMLAALAMVDARSAVLLYEEFVSHFVERARSSNEDWPQWQRAYDQEFKSWLNIFTTGMFNPDAEVDYSSSEFSGKETRIA